MGLITTKCTCFVAEMMSFYFDVHKENYLLAIITTKYNKE